MKKTKYRSEVAAAVHEGVRGMHRLGLDGEDLDRAIFLLRQHPELRVLSVFSHLAAADDQQHDAGQFQVVADHVGAQQVLQYPLAPQLR